MTTRKIREWFAVSTEPPLPRHEWYAISPSARGDYIELLRVAVQLGRAGVIPEAGAWQTKQWAAWGLTKSRVDSVVKAGLAERTGQDFSDLVLNFFDSSNEVTFEKQVISGRETAKNRGIGHGSPSGSPNGSPSGSPNGSPAREGDQIRGEGDQTGGGGGSEGNGAAASSAAALSILGDGTGEIIATLSASLASMPRDAFWTPGALNLSELPAHVAWLSSLPDLREAYRWFLGQPGRNSKDGHWRKVQHSLHVFRTQGYPAYRELLAAKEAKELEAAKAAQEKAQGRANFLAKLQAAAASLEGQELRPCDFHQENTNRCERTPNHLRLCLTCAYCVTAELAVLGKQAAQPALRSVGGAS